jgi:hypothetical protein
MGILGLAFVGQQIERDNRMPVIVEIETIFRSLPPRWIAPPKR